VFVNSAAAVDITIPLQSAQAFEANTVIVVVQEGAGAVTVEAAAGVTLNGVDGGTFTIGGANLAATLVRRAEDAWLVIGAGEFLSNPMTGPGQMIYGTTGGVPGMMEAGPQYSYARMGPSNVPQFAPMGAMAADTLDTGVDLGTGHFVKGMLIANKTTGFSLTIKRATGVNYPLDRGVSFLNRGAGTFTIQAETGVYLNGETGASIDIAPWEGGYLRHLATDAWAVPNYTPEA